MPTFKSKWGYHPCDHATFKKIKRVRYFLLLALKREAEHKRWSRKAPQNRVWRRRPHRAAKPEVLGPRAEPVLSPLSRLLRGDVEALERNYNYARFPVAGPEGVNGISEMWLECVDQWLVEGEEWLAKHGREVYRGNELSK